MRCDGTALSLEWFSAEWAKSASSGWTFGSAFMCVLVFPLSFESDVHILASVCPVLLFAGTLQTYLCDLGELFLALSGGQWKAGAPCPLPCTCGSRGRTVHHVYARGASASCSAVGLDQNTRPPFL